jgi:hypothetical protein
MTAYRKWRKQSIRQYYLAVGFAPRYRHRTLLSVTSLAFKLASKVASLSLSSIKIILVILIPC